MADPVLHPLPGARRVAESGLPTRMGSMELGIMYIYIYMCVYVYTYILMSIYIYIYVYIYTHAYTCIMT